MTTATLERHTTPPTTDGVRSGLDAGAAAMPSDGGLGDLTIELTSALDDALWSFMLGAELEEAIDSALLRAVIADTPTLSGAVWAD